MEHGTDLVTRRDPGMETCLFSSLLVLPVACRGLGARRQSLLSGLEPLRSLVVCFIQTSLTTIPTHVTHPNRYLRHLELVSQLTPRSDSSFTQ
jgi:hypothetical protein